MSRFTIFVYLLFFGGYLLVAGFFWLFVEEFIAQVMLYLLFGAVLGTAMAAAALFLIWQVLKGCWYLFDQAWPR